MLAMRISVYHARKEAISNWQLALGRFAHWDAAKAKCKLPIAKWLGRYLRPRKRMRVVKARPRAPEKVGKGCAEVISLFTKAGFWWSVMLSKPARMAHHARNR